MPQLLEEIEGVFFAIKIAFWSLRTEKLSATLTVGIHTECLRQ